MSTNSSTGAWRMRSGEATQLDLLREQRRLRSLADKGELTLVQRAGLRADLAQIAGLIEVQRTGTITLKTARAWQRASAAASMARLSGRG